MPLITPFGPMGGAIGGGAFAPFIAYGSGVTWSTSGSHKSADITLSNGNLTAESSLTTTQKKCVRASSGKTAGCWYWEITFTQTTNTNDHHIGIGDGGFDLETFLGGSANSAGTEFNGGDSTFETGSYTKLNNSPMGSVAQGTKIGCALDMDLGMFWYSKNGVWFGNPTVRTGAIFTGITGTCYAAIDVRGSDGGTLGGDKLTANFGATGFTYTPP